ncbi:MULTISPECIES: glycosyltransferase family 2 protein [Aphanothece]|uniref:glycosyltransferase family 2 protein n=1 Tax=Aphanothece TaxID=1121 RepID=UPI003984C867
MRNELAHLPRVLGDFYSQGIDVAIIDHESDDGTQEYLRSQLGTQLFHLESLAWRGEFDLTAQLHAKHALIQKLQHDWVIHSDADEWMQSPRPNESLKEGLARLDKEGFNVANFNEFVFVPSPKQHAKDCRRELLHYYFFEPKPMRLMRAWKREANLSSVEHGGHILKGPHMKVAHEDFILRHYIVLSQAHAISKYTGRVFSNRDIKRGWHGNRMGLNPESLRLPDNSLLKVLPNWSSVEFDKTSRRDLHFWHWIADWPDRATEDAYVNQEDY